MVIPVRRNCYCTTWAPLVDSACPAGCVRNGSKITACCLRIEPDGIDTGPLFCSPRRLSMILKSRARRAHRLCIDKNQQSRAAQQNRLALCEPECLLRIIEGCSSNRDILIRWSNQRRTPNRKLGSHHAPPTWSAFSISSRCKLGAKRKIKS